MIIIKQRIQFQHYNHEHHECNDLHDQRSEHYCIKYHQYEEQNKDDELQRNSTDTQ